jgi:hypothetical protein
VPVEDVVDIEFDVRGDYSRFTGDLHEMGSHMFADDSIQRARAA